MVQVLGLGTPTAGSLGSIPARGTNILQKKKKKIWYLSICNGIVFIHFLKTAICNNRDIS